MSSMLPTGKWYYSFDEDEWHCGDGYDTPEDALADGREAAPDFADECEMEDDDRSMFLTVGHVYIGQGYRFNPVVDADRVLEQLREEADEETCGCHDTDYLDGPSFRAPKAERAAWQAKVDDLSQRLTSVFNEWAKETGNLPYFTMISDIQQHYIADPKPFSIAATKGGSTRSSKKLFRPSRRVSSSVSIWMMCISQAMLMPFTHSSAKMPWN